MKITALVVHYKKNVIASRYVISERYTFVLIYDKIKYFQI